jgi:hypothetical protein
MLVKSCRVHNCLSFRGSFSLSQQQIRVGLGYCARQKIAFQLGRPKTVPYQAFTDFSFDLGRGVKQRMEKMEAEITSMTENVIRTIV